MIRSPFCIGGPLAGHYRAIEDRQTRFAVDIDVAPLACRPQSFNPGLVRRHRLIYKVELLKWDQNELWIAFPDDKDLTWAMAELLEGYREGRSW